ncbi:MAG TPA: hypothetical protein VGQ36_23470 [Thermoanaerobaculia bacterium]|jgi:hypothetical protein|nr:hypothetical protein [Thermoanaerobaculia bacterium]
MANATLDQPITGLNEAEKKYLERARRMFAENTDWLEFESFAFGMQSPVFAKTRSHKNILEHPLYRALTDMWLELGVRQGKVADDERGSEEGSR